MFCLTMLFCVGNMIFNSFDTSFFKVTQLLKDIDLTEQKDTLSLNLSLTFDRNTLIVFSPAAATQMLVVFIFRYTDV